MVNPISVNTQGLQGTAGFGAKPQAKEDGEAKESQVGATANEKAQLSGNEVLSFMAQSSVNIAPKIVDTTKYVDSTSAERIAGFMAGFEDKVAEGLAAFDKEFGDSMTPKTKETLVLAKLNVEA